ncbi:uncharacterized protein MONOS_12501 [Monocercomonoides exilis]|uniref:uncharacterized protein n=1 Tax=Monocercomonoides exilis TaxID=2049356 RepID=UPI003559FEE0|nr:hypothetical protein MONOS_12501 [Monocercomonoides exilis]|eukprot:MONOS_12501.1-p1 / transcript=MONOS_12501.1 / gene=MONOS_12501 / organism=Monocercomonoides_exilis_PA203 / gene_product=unspecified product / transcript_product=unspecified product / location=Mono_scaffold00695:20325-20864(+) / protein_length=180 / sequence_SO=supercontig / SO=protein_coding / is_pseudo=false
MQDTKWILETISGPAPRIGEENKPDKSGEAKEGRLKIADKDWKDRTEELQKAGFEEGKKLTRKRSRGRKKLPNGEVRRGEMAQSRSSTPRQPSRQKIPSIIPRNISELTGEKDPTPLKKRGKDRKRRSGRRIGQIGNDTENAGARPLSLQKYTKRCRVKSRSAAPSHVRSQLIRRTRAC